MHDTLLMICSCVLSYALLPLVYSGFRYKTGYVNAQTSLITIIALTVMSFTFFDLELWFTTITTSITNLMWVILLIQRLCYGEFEKAYNCDD